MNKRSTGYMYLPVAKVKSRMSIRDIIDIVFSSSASYREIALEVLTWIKDVSIENGRSELSVSRSELSSFINRSFGKNRRSTAYKVLREFLIPMGLLSLDSERGLYVVSREFARALRRLADAYEAWMKV
ncbi:MAG: hypothetical protein QXK12_04030 [Candidatus Nezhaarchaeales archaeon]